MSKYIVSSLSKFSDLDNEIPRVDNIILFNKKPTFDGAREALYKSTSFDEDEWTKINDETWELYSYCYDLDNFNYYQIKIQTPERHKEMVNNWIQYIKLNTTPKEVTNVAN